MKLTDGLYFYPERGMLDCNKYVIRGRASIIIDTGSPEYLPLLVGDLKKDGIDLKDISIIANSHLHIDHCSGNEVFKKLSDARILIHPIQKEFYQDAMSAANVFGLESVGFQEDALFEDNKLKLEDIELELIPSPGHSPDSVCFYSPQGKFLVCGDVLFEENTGRVDLPGGSADKLKKSIEALSNLDIDYLLPGHMGIINGAEKVKNNFEFISKYVFEWL